MVTQSAGGVCSALAGGVRLGAAAQKGSFVLASLGRLAHRRAVLRPAGGFALTSQLVEPAAIVTPSPHTLHEPHDDQTPEPSRANTETRALEPAGSIDGASKPDS